MGNETEKKLMGEAEKRARCWRRCQSELPANRLARLSMIGLCSSLLEAVVMASTAWKPVYKSAKEREQWAAVHLLVLLLSTCWQCDQQAHAM